MATQNIKGGIALINVQSKQELKLKETSVYTLDNGDVVTGDLFIDPTHAEVGILLVTSRMHPKALQDAISSAVTQNGDRAQK